MSMESGARNEAFERNPEAADVVWDAIEALSEGIAVYDAGHRLITCNQRYVDMYPMVADLIERGAVWEDLIRAGAERGQYVAALGRVEEWMAERLSAGMDFRLSKAKQTREIELTSGSIYEAQFSPTRQGGFVVTNIDITERRQAENIAREQENILRTVLETSPIVVIMARLRDGRILYRSPGAVAMFGNTVNALEHYVDPKDREAYLKKLRETGRVDDFHITLRNADGTLCPTTSWGRMVEFEGDTYVVTAVMDLSEQKEHEAMIRRVLEACPAPIQMTKAETGEVLFSSPETISLFGKFDSAKQFYADPETRVRYLKKMRRDGAVSEFKAEYINAEGKKFWGAIDARLIQYKGEDVIVSHTRDLTEQLRIEAEMAQQQDQLHQNEKMSAMGELLAGVAHELNNPLSVVVGHSLMLREDCTDPETLRQVEKISQAAERCAKIVKTFLTMARQQPARMQHVDINDIVQTAVDVARYGDKGDGIAMTCDLDASLPNVCADPDQITQVFINLILNAEQAMRDSGTGTAITVTTRTAKNGDGIEISFEDDGPGVPKNIRNRVFEPFFTTKDVGEGTGIGLALCHRIVQSHNGSIKLSSGADGGSTFRIFLPREFETATLSEPTEQAATPDPSVRILILDDEYDVAELNAEILSRSGYQVDIFNNAKDAVTSMARHDYGLILSDLNMPETDGRGFFEIIRRDFPHMTNRIGFVTGDTMGRASQTFLGEAKRPSVEKPVSPKELRAFVADIIAQSEQVSE